MADCIEKTMSISTAPDQTPTPGTVCHLVTIQRTPLAAASARSALHALALADGHRRLVVDGRGAHALLDLAGHGQEGLLDVGGALR